LNLGSSTTNSVTLSGTPTPAAPSTFTIRITDAASQTGSQAYTVTISNPPAPSITTTSLPDGAVNTAYNQTIQATGGLAPFAWTVSAGTPPAGLHLGNSTTNSVALSGTPTTAQSNVGFTIQVTDSLSQAGSHAYTVSIAALPIIVTISNKISTIQAGAAAVTLNAVVQHDTQGVAWTLTANGSACSPTCGTLGNITTTGVEYTPPTTVPSAPDNAPTITATSVTDNTKTDTDSFTITSVAASCTVQGNEAVLNGQYAFSLAGYNSTGFAALVGSLTADGAGHLSGVLDMNGAFGLHTQVSISPGGSSYSVGSDNRGCAVIATSSGTFTTRIAVGSLSSNVATKGRIIEWETGASAFIASGQLLKQTISGGLSGAYVFSIAGQDHSGPVPIACAGAINGSGGNFSAGEEDCNDGGTPDHETGMTGTYTSLDASGRATASLLTSHGTSTIVFYMASSSKLLMLGTDPQSSTPSFSGEMRSQSGTFNNASLSGIAVFYMSGFSGGGNGDATLGLLNGSSGTATISLYEDNGGTFHTSLGFSCSYAVASNGRVILTGTNCTGQSPVLYLTAANAGLMVNAGGVSSGAFEPQAAGPFSNSSESGTFFTGTSLVPLQSAEPGVGWVTLTNGSVTGVSDDTSPTFQNADGSFSDTYTVNSAGWVTLAGDSNPTLVVISGSKLVKIDPSKASDPNPMLLILEK
jgi:Putative Ig domain